MPELGQTWPEQDAIEDWWRKHRHELNSVATKYRIEREKEIERLVNVAVGHKVAARTVSLEVERLQEQDEVHWKTRRSLLKENERLKAAGESGEPTISFRDFKWACGHCGPAVCKQCWDEKLKKRTALLKRQELLEKVVEAALAFADRTLCMDSKCVHKICVLNRSLEALKEQP